MRILALDLATVAGFCFGEAGDMPPQSFSIRLAPRGADPHTASRALGPTLRDRFFRFKESWPEMIVAEDHLHPTASIGGDAIVSQVLLHGALNAIAAAYGVQVRRIPAATIRKHFCGKSSALPRGKGERTPKEKAEARKATKAMVVGRCHALGYFPNSVIDDNRADACAAWDWASANIARVAPRDLRMFGEAAS